MRLLFGPSFCQRKSSLYQALLQTTRCLFGLPQNRGAPALAFRRAPAAALRVSALFGFGGGKREKSEKEQEKEEAYRVQQEVLARRRNNSWQKVGARAGGPALPSGACPAFCAVAPAGRRSLAR